MVGYFENTTETAHHSSTFETIFSILDPTFVTQHLLFSMGQDRWSFNDQIVDW